MQQLDGIDIDVETKCITHPQWSELTWPCSAHNRLAVLTGSTSKRFMSPKQIKPPEAFHPMRSSVGHRTTVFLFFLDDGAVVLLNGWKDVGEKEVVSIDLLQPNKAKWDIILL